MPEKALILNHHGSGYRAEKDEVYSIPEVARTVTWNPLHHREVDIALRNAIQAYDHEIVDSEYSLSQNGMRLFGVFVLKSDMEEKTFIMGWRNAMDKSMSIGMCCGLKVFVCSNLAMSGEFTEFRKHTSRLCVEELQEMSFRAVQQIGSGLQEFADWHEGLRQFAITRSDAEALTFRAVERGVLPAGRFSRFLDIFFNGNSDGLYDYDLHGFHGALTELRRDNSLIGSGRWNKDLNTLMNTAIIDLKQYKVITN